MSKELTPRQKEILDFIKEYQQEKGYAPSIRDIASNFNLASTFGVMRHVEALEKKGYLSKAENIGRGITLAKPDVEPQNDEIIRVPILGRVAAGTPILAIENFEGSICLDSTILKSHKDHFALKVAGNSMIDAGIFDGDIVIIKAKNDAENGDIVCAMVDDEVTIKNYYKSKNKIRLLPQNKDYKPIEVSDQKRFAILGKIVAVFRSLE